jgi:cyclopropane-fatty-acyl-phospholipid synthase
MGSAALPEHVSRRLAAAMVPIAIRMPDGRVESLGQGKPMLEVQVANGRGLEALGSLNELNVVEAYLDGDLELEGDLISGMDLRKALRDVQPLTRAWTLVQPALVGRRRLNPEWVAKHYDRESIQLLAIDEGYQVYTPGIYLDEDDSLEEGAERKLEYAFGSLGLEAGRSLLDVGCGWGGFLRYCARRGVEATGISLSRHQLDYARRGLEQEGLAAELRYQDFFDYEPGRRFDAISLMGSLEELADYRKVVQRLDAWLEPGGLVYLDFASADRPFGIASFVTKYVWPGAFRMVYMPSFMRALARSHFDVVEIQNDRRNYYLWARGSYERWMRRKAEVVEASDERTWRLMRILMAGTAHLMGPRSIWATSYRVVLERRSSPARARAGVTARGGAIPA